MKAFSLPAVALLLICASAAYGSSLEAVIADTAPKIDGDLSDACWQSASSVSDFFYTDSGAPGSEKTTARLVYDHDCIYVAFDCTDSQPEFIRAQQTKRGGNMSTDDYVTFVLDPFSEYRLTTLARFKVNAVGTQTHEVQSSETGKTEWIGDWDAAVKRTPGGWSAEMRIPFSILKYSSQDPQLSVGFIRHHARQDQEWWSPDIGPNDDIARLFRWEGVQPPWRKEPPVLMAYSLFGTGDGDVPNRFGLDVKQALGPSLTGLMTVSPDFASIEQDLDSVDFTYTERTLEDNRPFFREGKQYFPTESVFYTRRIAEIDTGAKLVGVSGNYKLAFLNARRSSSESYTIGQVGRQFGRNKDLSIALGGVQADVEGTNNFTAFSTVEYRLMRPGGKRIDLKHSYVGGDSAIGFSQGSWNRYTLTSVNGPKNIEYRLERSIVDTDYQPYLGLEIESGLRSWSPEVYYWDAPESGPLSMWYVNMASSFAEHLDGSRFYETLNPSVYVEWRDGHYAGLGYTRSDRPPNVDGYWDAHYAWGQNDLYRGGSLTAALGKLTGGDYQYYSAIQGFRLSDKFSVQAWYSHIEITEPSIYAGSADLGVLSLTYDMSAQRGLVARLVQNQRHANLYFAYRQRVRSGLDAYLIYGDPNSPETRDRVLLKLVQPL